MYAKGLKGIIAAETSLSYIDGNKGELIYRGTPVHDLAIQSSFEEVAYFLWYGVMPTKEQLNELTLKMRNDRILPAYIKEILALLPLDLSLMDVLRTVISSLVPGTNFKKPTIEEAIRITAIMPTVIAYRYRQHEGLTPIEPKNEYSHVANYLYMLNGQKPEKSHVGALETYMILTMEHGMNASTFSARVTASTESDLISAVTSAIGTMKGPLHGGAPTGVLDLLDEIEYDLNAEPVIREKLNRNEKLMGFGHRVYRTNDPRAIALKEKLLKMNSDDPWLKLALHVEEIAIHLLEEFKPGRKLMTNVEFYAAAIMRAIKMDPALFTPTFSASRTVGWTAHIIEQANNNTIFRPQSLYVGK
ncbi:citrate synthase [Salirhabdus euzebyi]|uniref:Citrate synthase n=1 Tax=Salirhabdus euzebyi TaxID=394506 RepID=A0A841PUU3_9BACI|nr:citrate synthase/methylcitrate synthase [Salirhabdus euzebyi]MBB6452777.1 citrate synthase [Salirhabdus euzebyi]